MSYKNWITRMAVIASVLLGLATGRTAMGQARITSAIQNENRIQVAGSTSPLVARSVDKGRMSAGQNLGRMLLLMAPSADQEAQAQELISALHDSSSPLFHQWLTPAEYGQRFGVADTDATQVQRWLQSQGLTVHEVSQSRRFIVFSGSVSQVENAFSTQMHSYTYKNQDFISNSSDIKLPVALQTVVKGVVRLHSDPHKPALVLGGKVHFKKAPGLFSFDDGSHHMTPADFAKIYNVQPLYDAGINGTGQTIAIVGRSNIDLKSVTDFRAIVGLPPNDPEIIVNGDDPGQTGYDMPEALLDVTWSGAVAPMAHIKFVVSQSNFADGVDVSAAYIVDHNLAPIMSTSYGSCESTLGPVENAFYNSLWQQAAAQGITSFVSTGDNGGAGCDQPQTGNYATGGLAVNGIASTPYNVAVGGTQFDDTDNPDAYWSGTNDPTTGQSVLSYIPEKAWNESTNDPNLVSLLGGSGGVSTIYAKPNWQNAPGVPNDGKRDLPDFSLSAALHTGYLVCLYDSCSFGNYFYAFGGTSASSPSAAGIMALVNQKLGGQPQGMANYVFYKLASVPGVYHDITKGDNKVPDQLGQYTVGYSAGTGYDLATGLGSFDANALVNNWQNAAATKGSAVTLKLANGQAMPVVHGTAVNFQAKVACSGSCSATPTGSVSVAATTSSGDYIDSGAGQLNGAGTANIQTSSLPGGTYGVTAHYSGDGTYVAGSSTPVQVTITSETSQTYVGAMSGGSFTTAPLQLGYGEHMSVGVVVAGKSGQGYPSGQVSLLADGQPANTVWFDPGTGNLLPSPLTLNYGEKTALITGGSAPTSQSSTVSYLLPSDKLFAGTHHLQASYPGDGSFGSSQSDPYTFTVTKAESVLDPTYLFADGTVVANTPVKLIGEVIFTNGGFAPFGGTVTVTDITGATPVAMGTGVIDNSIYEGLFEVVMTFKTPGVPDPNCYPAGSACMHILRFDYPGDANVTASSGTAHVPVAANSSSSTSLSADVSTAAAGSPVTLTASVSSDVRLYTPTGTVSFFDGSTNLGTATLDSTGTATFVTKALTSGAHNLVANYSGDAILTASVSDPPVAEMITDYIIQALPATLTIQDGQSGTATLNIIPVGGFAQAVQLSCGTLPANITCSFSPASVTPNGVDPSIVTLTVKTGGALASRVGENHLWAATSTFALAGILLPFGTRKRRKIQNALAVLGLIVVGLYVGGCGGGSTNPNEAVAGTYTINIAATSGDSTAPKAATLVVKITK